MIKIISNVGHEIFVDVLTEKGLVKEKLLPGKFIFSEKLTDSLNNQKRKGIVRIKTVSKVDTEDSSQKEVTTSKVTTKDETATEKTVEEKKDSKATKSKKTSPKETTKKDGSSEELFHIDMKGGEK